MHTALRTLVHAAAITAAASFASPTALGAQAPERLTQFLQSAIKLDAKQLAQIEKGETVVSTLETPTSRDVAVFGIITTRVPRESFVKYLSDFPSSLRTPGRLRFGIFSSPAVLGDVQGMNIETSTPNQLKDCKPGDCVFKLPEAEIQRMRTSINWSAPDAQAQVATYVKQRVLEYVTDYRAKGDAAMIAYDGAKVVRASDAFNALLQQSPYVYEFVPSLQQYLSSYPSKKLEGSTEIMFWSEDAAPRLRKTMSLSHVVLYSPPELPRTTLLASKQIYSDHYFEAAFDLTTIIERPNPSGGAGTYVLALRRYRFDNLPSGGLLNIRGRAINALREQLAADLGRMRDAAEARVAAR